MTSKNTENIAEVIQQDVAESGYRVSNQRMSLEEAKTEKLELEQQLQDAEMVAAQEETASQEAKETKEKIAEVTGE